MELQDLISFTIGFLLGIYVIYLSVRTEIPHGLNSKDVIEQIYHDENGAYHLVPKVYLCPPTL
jgi:hypothetical protein